MKLTLNCKPFSINAYSYRDKRHKTAEARAWEAQVLELLEPYEKALLELADDWRKGGGVWRIKLYFFYPMHIFYNKDGQISSKSMDLTNVEKPLVDMIFGQVMGVNDKSIVECQSFKLPYAMYAIEVHLELNANLDSDSLISAALDSDEDRS